MSETTVKQKRVANAMIWAALMIASALILKGQDGAKVLMFLYIAGWFVTNSLIDGTENFFKAECAAFRRLIGKD